MAPPDVWPCSLCNLTFLSEAALEKHKMTHNKEKSFSCEECGEKYATSTGLKIHMRQHTGERPYKCDHCPKAFTTRSVLNMHRRGHTGEKPYVCKICGVSFTQNASLVYHSDKHSKNKQYKCQYCVEIFPTLLHRLKHMRKVHYPETCGICKKKFKTKKGLLAHEGNHVHDKSLQCDLCGKTFRQKTHLRAHVLSHDENKTYTKCDVCGRVTLDKYLSAHMKSHNPSQCSVCGKRVIKMKRHMAVVHGKPDEYAKRVQSRSHFRRFICNVCGHKTNKRKSMANHNSKCQLQPPFVKFFCDFCEKECSDYLSFEAHVFEHSEVPLSLPFVLKKPHENPAWVVKKYNQSKNHRHQAFPSTTAKEVNVSSARHTQIDSNNTIRSAANETLRCERPLSTWAPVNVNTVSVAPIALSSVNFCNEQYNSFQYAWVFVPKLRPSVQEESQNVSMEEEISVKEEVVAEDSLPYAQNNGNGITEHYPRCVHGTSLMHCDGITYMKTEQNHLQ